jgi:hypothetical protein
MEAVCSSETSVNLYQITQRYNPEGSTLLSYRVENLKSKITKEYQFLVLVYACDTHGILIRGRELIRHILTL